MGCFSMAGYPPPPSPLLHVALTSYVPSLFHLSILFLEIKELSFIALSNIGEGGGHGYPNDFCHWNIKVSYILEINLIFLKISFVYLFAARSRHGNTEAMFQYSLTWFCIFRYDLRSFKNLYEYVLLTFSSSSSLLRTKCVVNMACMHIVWIVINRVLPESGVLEK